MTDACHNLDSAVARFDAVHDLAPDGSARAYHQRLARWVEQLADEPSEPLRLAAHCQHLRRWALPRADFPAGLSGYKRWRSTLARMHADEAETILRDVGYDGDIIDRVRALLLKKGLKTDPEVQLFEDAICLAFIEGELEAFAKKHDEDKLVVILQKTWKKMSPRGHAAALELSEALDASTRVLIGRALGQP